MAVVTSKPKGSHLFDSAYHEEVSAANTELTTTTTFAAPFRLSHIHVQTSAAPGAGTITVSWVRSGTVLTLATKALAQNVLIGVAENIHGLHFGVGDEVRVNVPAAGAAVTATVRVIGDMSPGR